MDTSRFIICRASAGSGKTYTLVRQYLELAFSATGDALATRFSRILAITFTNKAANEMKERILRELNTIALKGANCDMGADLALALGIDGDILRQRAAIVTASCTAWCAPSPTTSTYPWLSTSISTLPT